MVPNISATYHMQNITQKYKCFLSMEATFDAKICFSTKNNVENIIIIP